MQLLKEYIRALLENKDLLGEPDFETDEDEERSKSREDEDSAPSNLNTCPDPKKEQAVAGATTPLGTCPEYPDPCPSRPMTPAQAAGSGFGGAKPLVNKKRN